MPDSAKEHQRCASDQVKAVRCAVLTVSDTRTAETDRGGPTAARLLEEAGHAVVARTIIADEPEAIRTRLEAWIADPGVEAVVATGGTGLSRRDVTVDVVRGLLTFELEGFGELFRMLSYEQVGAAAMLSRSLGGVASRGGADTFLFALPGSVKAVELAVSRLIGPQLAHLVWHRRK